MSVKLSKYFKFYTLSSYQKEATCLKWPIYGVEVNFDLRKLKVNRTITPTIKRLKTIIFLELDTIFQYKVL